MKFTTKRIVIFLSVFLFVCAGALVSSLAGGLEWGTVACGFIVFWTFIIASTGGVQPRNSAHELQPAPPLPRHPHLHRHAVCGVGVNAGFWALDHYRFSPADMKRMELGFPPAGLPTKPVYRWYWA